LADPELAGSDLADSGGGRSGGAVIGCPSAGGLVLAASPGGGAKGGAAVGSPISGSLLSDPNVKEDGPVGAEGISPPFGSLPLEATPLPDDPAPLSGSEEQPAAAAISPISNQAQARRVTLESNNIANLLEIIAIAVVCWIASTRGRP
jgi:hypothetical protein